MRAFVMLSVGLCVAGAVFVQNAEQFFAFKQEPARSPLKAPSASAAVFGARSHTIARKADGHFYVDAKVEGRPVSFLVDTGASTVLLSMDDATRLGRSLPRHEFKHEFRTASGVTYAARIKLDQIRIGGQDFADVEAYVIPQGLTISLLGQSILARYASVQMRQDTLELRW